MERVNPKILIIPSVKYSDLKFEDYFDLFSRKSNKGGALTDISLYQKESFNNLLKKGGSFWGFLSNLAKKTLPYINKYIIPEALNLGTNLLHKSQSSEGLKKSDIKNLSKKSLKNIVSKAINSGGYKSHKQKIDKLNQLNNKRIKKNTRKKVKPKKNKLKNKKRIKRKAKKQKKIVDIFSTV